MLKKRMLAITLSVLVALGVAGCSSSGEGDAVQGAGEPSASSSAEQGARTASYSFAGVNLEIPEYWKANPEKSEAGVSLSFELEGSSGILNIEYGDVPQVMTLKTQGNNIVAASDEEIAEQYISRGAIRGEHEKVVSEIEVIDDCTPSYMRKTFEGTVDYVEYGEVESVERKAVMLLDDNTKRVEVWLVCPVEHREYLDDVDVLMRSFADQM